jgi:Na+/proline symporter
MLWVYYQQQPLAIPIPELRPGVTKHDYVFPIFIVTVVPPVLKGFLIVGILSAAMSSVSSALAALASVSTMDFVKPLWRSDRSEAFYLQFSRHSTLAWGAILIVVAWLTQQAQSVLDLAFSLNGLTSGAMLGGLSLAVGWKQGRSLPIVAGMAASVAFMVTLHTGWRAQVGWPWYTLIGTVVTVAVAWLTRRVQSSCA